MKLLMVDDYQLPVIACFFLFIAMIMYWINLYFTKNTFLKPISNGLVLFSNLLFVLTLGSRWIGEHYFPLSNLYESLIFLSWGISSIHLYIEYKTKSRLFGSLSTPLLFFLSGFSSLTLPTDMQKALPLVPSLQSNWLMMHVSMMMVSYATLIVGSLFSIFYLFLIYFSNIPTNKKRIETSNEEKYTEEQNLQLSFQTITNSQISTSNTLELIPAKTYESISQAQLSIENNSKLSLLQIVDIWSYRIIGLGFPFLTIGIISGAVWANEAWGAYWSWDPKETWALITWLVFAIYLHARLIKGWQGEKAAFLGSCGFFVIWICYLGVNFLGKGLHSYGWVF